MRYPEDFINKLICGNAFEILKEIPSESVSCCVCSPPYWSLRDYGVDPVMWDGDKNCKHIWGNKAITLKHKSGETNPGKEGWFKDRGASDDKGNCFCLRCGVWKGSLGLEPDFNLYVKHLCDIFDEVKRVLRKDGTCWVNLGDSYAGSGKGIGTDRDKCKESYSDNDIRKSNWQDINISAKSLCLIPQRFAIEMVNRGWILRNTIIWHKPNCMPSSAKDRFTVDFEYVYFFVKSKKYWFEQQFEDVNWGIVWSRKGTVADTPHLKNNPRKNWGLTREELKNGKTPPQNRNKRAVWTIPTQPFPEAHFAVYPEKLIEPMIKAGCPRYVCKKCGKARVKIYRTKVDPNKVPKKWRKTYRGKVELDGSPTKRSVSELYAESLAKEKTFIDYTDCGCDAGWESGIVLDPFMGAGTSALVALKQRKRFTGIEIKQEYIDMAKKRISKIQQELI